MINSKNTTIWAFIAPPSTLRWWLNLLFYPFHSKTFTNNRDLLAFNSSYTQKPGYPSVKDRGESKEKWQKGRREDEQHSVTYHTNPIKMYRAALLLKIYQNCQYGYEYQICVWQLHFIFISQTGIQVLQNKTYSIFCPWDTGTGHWR